MYRFVNSSTRKMSCDLPCALRRLTLAFWNSLASWTWALRQYAWKIVDDDESTSLVTLKESENLRGVFPDGVGTGFGDGGFEAFSATVAAFSASSAACRS